MTQVRSQAGDRSWEEAAHRPSSFLSVRAVLSQPLPNLDRLDRLLLRTATLAARQKIISIGGLERIAPVQDPFILALNHSTRQEALLVPPTLMLLRSGRRIHFLADWNFRLIPGVNLLYRRSGAITVTRKSAKPRVLNVFKPLFRGDASPLEQARQHLLAGRSIGIFPEGTVNRDPSRLMRGRFGAARLSLETGVPIVPVGLSFPTVPAGCSIPDGSPLRIEIGVPLHPPCGIGATVSIADVRCWHSAMMTAIGKLSEKAWQVSELEAEHEKIDVHEDAARLD